MKAFTDIKQFRDVVRSIRQHHDYKGKNEREEAIYLHDTPYPTIKFRGTVKLHGTNSAIVKYSDGTIKFQSRERDLTLQDDNHDFMLAMSNINVEKLFEGIKFQDHCAIYGEWCGSGIQKSVAISQLPKMFIIFGIRVDDVYLPIEDFSQLKMEENRVFNILQFEHFYLDIDFNEPELAQNKLVELTQEVENECPVGKYFGINGTGEGIVWESILSTGERYIFKVKGTKHSSSKVKKLAEVDIEQIDSIKEFVEYAVTENRLSQGIDKMRELGIPLVIESTGEYLRWVYNDVIKEEKDTIIKNQLEVKKLGAFVSQKARQYWMEFLKNLTY